VAQVWTSAIAGLAGGGKNKKINQEEELFSEVFSRKYDKIRRKCQKERCQAAEDGAILFC